MHTDAFALTAGTREELTEYRFGRRVFARFFCPTCGVEIFETKADEGMLGVNVRTVDGVEMERLRIRPFDGATLYVGPRIPNELWAGTMYCWSSAPLYC